MLNSLCNIPNVRPLKSADLRGLVQFGLSGTWEIVTYMKEAVNGRETTNQASLVPRLRVNNYPHNG